MCTCRPSQLPNQIVSDHREAKVEKDRFGSSKAEKNLWAVDAVRR